MKCPNIIRSWLMSEELELPPWGVPGSCLFPATDILLWWKVTDSWRRWFIQVGIWKKKKSICLKVCVLMLVTLHSKRHFGQMLHLISGDGRKTQGEATGLAAERRSRTTTSIGNAQRSPRGPDCPEQSPGTLTHTLSAYRSGALFKLKSSIAFLPGSWCKCACF